MTQAEMPPTRRQGLQAAVSARVRPLVERIPARLRLPLGIAAMSELVFLVWWAAFYPGLMSYDSFDYTWEVTTGHWVDDHSIAYDGAVWLTLNVTGDYAVLTLLQTIAMAAVLGYLAAGMRKFAIRNGWIITGVLLCVVLPPTGSFVIFVWKDVPFVIGAVLGFAAIVHLTSSTLRVRPRRSRVVGLRRDWLLLASGMMLVCLARNNGFLAVFLIGVLLLAALPWLWKQIAAVILIPIVLFFAIDSGLYPALGVTKPADNAAYTFVYSDIAAAYNKAPSTFTKSDLKVMAEVSPLSHWSSAGGYCVSTDKLTTSAFHTSIAAKHNSQLLHVFAEVMKRTPNYVFDSSLCRAHNAWAIFPGYDPIGIAAVASSPNGYGLLNWHPEMYHSKFYPDMKVRPLSSTLHVLGSFWYNSSLTSQLIWIFWGGAVWCYIAYGVVVSLIRKTRRREILALAVVTAGMQLNVLAATPSALYRYMAAPTFLGILLLPFIFSQLKRQPAEAEPGSEPAKASEGKDTTTLEMV